MHSSKHTASSNRTKLVPVPSQQHSQRKYSGTHLSTITPATVSGSIALKPDRLGHSSSATGSHIFPAIASEGGKLAKPAKSKTFSSVAKLERPAPLKVKPHKSGTTLTAPARVRISSPGDWFTEEDGPF
jgi:hypothetical protein